MSTRHPFTRAVLTLGALTFLASGLLADDDDEPKESPKAPKGGVFTGKWVNRKMRSSGPLTCDLKPGGEGEWSARFEGTFKGEGFKYDVKFAAKTTGTKTAFKGDAVIDGDPYQWTGSLKGDAFNVKYRSTKGYTGDFTLKRTTAAKKSPKRGS
jgi:hypothetical protein